MPNLYAHTHPDGPAHWEPLLTHLTQVADLSQTFADAFGAGPLAHLAGLWHDLGKASTAFQTHVLQAHRDEGLAEDHDHGSQTIPTRRRVDHSTAGARHAKITLGNTPFGDAVAYAILAHHGRLPDHAGNGSNATFAHRMDPARYPVEPFAPPAGLPPTPPLPALVPEGFKQPAAADLPFQHALLTRMLFSALVDADRLCTEAFMNPARARLRPAPTPPPADLLASLDRHLDRLTAQRAHNPAPVDQHRAAVLAACRARAANAPGLFTLTVPTGGGKTLASAAFALAHAQHHGQRRLVYALPFTSIIEQTAQTYRDVFGDRHVLEHHSNLDATDQSTGAFRRALAAENFDAPIVVTTNVQLFESLFSAHGGTCRKLHRLANSVIVLDEAQSIPPRLLRPALAVLRRLVADYRCTVVLCTATQPAVKYRDDFDIGFRDTDVTEIIPDPPSLYNAMRRVDTQDIGPIDDAPLTDRLATHDQALCIVNTKRHAAELTALLQDRVDNPATVVHLSAGMCPQHRTDKLGTVRQRLKDGLPIRVIATQVIEAGVDVDFPTVYRALAGFDSVAQAAGRCNREGRRNRGNLHLFRTRHKPPRGLRVEITAAEELIELHPDPLALTATDAYFRLLYGRRAHEGDAPWDTRNVMGCFGQRDATGKTTASTRHQFREADTRFNWIDSVTTPVIVPYDRKGQDLVHHLQHLPADAPPDWTTVRAAQRYVVSLYDQQRDQLLENTVLSPVPAFGDSVWVINNPDSYDNTIGLRFDVEGREAGSMIL